VRVLPTVEVTRSTLFMRVVNNVTTLRYCCSAIGYAGLDNEGHARYTSWLAFLAGKERRRSTEVPTSSLNSFALRRVSLRAHETYTLELLLTLFSAVPSIK